jgi:hypothetical protein
MRRRLLKLRRKLARALARGRGMAADFLFGKPDGDVYVSRTSRLGS